MSNNMCSSFAQKNCSNLPIPEVSYKMLGAFFLRDAAGPFPEHDSFWHPSAAGVPVLPVTFGSGNRGLCVKRMYHKNDNVNGKMMEKR